MNGVTLADGNDYSLWNGGLGESYDNIADGLWGVAKMYDQGKLDFLHVMFHETRQPGCTIKLIADGYYDHLIEDYLMKVLAYVATGRKVVIVYLPEMNGDWTVYGPEGHPTWGADPDSFIKAYRDFVDRGRSMGLDDMMVKWCWAPNNYGWEDPDSELSPLERWYPGDAWVDVVGGSAYNWSGLYPGYEWRSPSELFDPYIEEIRGFTRKPIVITQTGAGLNDPRTPQWIDDLVSTGVDFIYFNIGEFEYQDRDDWNERVPDSDRPDYWFEEVRMKVFIVGDTGLLDGLALWPMAGLGDVLLYVSRDSIPTSIREELERLNPGEIVIVGGPARVSDAVEEQLKEIAYTTRVYGHSRFDTTVAISKKVNP